MSSLGIVKGFLSCYSPAASDSRIVISPKDCFLGDILTFSQTKQVLEAIEQNVNSLHALPKKQALQNCKKISNGVQILIKYSEDAVGGLRVKKQEENEKLARNDNQYVEVFQKLQRETEHLRDLESQRQTLQLKHATLSTSIQQHSSEIKKLEGKIQKADTRRIDALTDLIPGVGLVGGLVTGRYKRMIPFYSQVRGIKSVAENDKEDFQSRLETVTQEYWTLNVELMRMPEKIDQQRQVVSLANLEITRLKSEKDALASVRKVIGVQLTCVKNFIASLQRIQGKYQFLSVDLIGINSDIQGEILRKSTVDNFMDELRSIQNSIDELMKQEIESLFSTISGNLTTEQKTLHNRLYRLFACLNISEHTSAQFQALFSQELSFEQQSRFHFIIYLVCKSKGYDTNDPEFGKRAITNKKIPTTLFKHAILDYAFRIGTIEQGSALLD